jgi:UDP-N-acetyl-D-galactosamine dehydrogenase
VAREYDTAQSRLGAFTGLDALILAVPHRAYIDIGARGIADMLSPGGICIDVKAQLAEADFPAPRAYWSL